MKRLIYISICALLSFTSCSDDENNFDKKSYKRIDELFTDCDKTLKSSEYGWKMQYYPDLDRRGGYNFLFRFEDNGQVIMAADFRNEEQKSSYKYYGGQGAILSFDSYSFLHILADPSYAPVGLGGRGDYELVIQKITPDTVYCVGRKWRQPMVFVKARQDDWAGMDKIKANEKMLVPVGEDTPFFRNIKVSGKGIATFLYDYSNRFVEYYYNDNKGNVQSGRMSVIFSKEGFQLREPIQVDGVTLKNFVYDENTQGFTFGEHGTLTIEHTSTVVFKDAWDSFYERQGGNLYQLSRDFMNVFEEARALVPDFVAFQLYWNISGMRLFSFVMVDVESEKQETRWFHAVTKNVEELEDGCVVFTPNKNAAGYYNVVSNSDAFEDECKELFYSDTEASVSLRKILDIYYDPEGFTVIPTAEGNYYLISKARSNYWMLFRPI